jgi:mono/diheme cytochrome c family protein
VAGKAGGAGIRFAAPDDIFCRSPFIRNRSVSVADFRSSIVTLAFVLTASAARLPAQGPSPAPGAQVFAAQKCSICHAIAGAGNKKLPLDDVGSKVTADEIRQWILTPQEMAKKTNSTVKPPMKAFTNLPKADLDALVSYLATLKK